MNATQFLYWAFLGIGLFTLVSVVWARHYGLAVIVTGAMCMVGFWMGPPVGPSVIAAKIAAKLCGPGYSEAVLREFGPLINYSLTDTHCRLFRCTTDELDRASANAARLGGLADKTADACVADEMRGWQRYVERQINEARAVVRNYDAEAEAARRVKEAARAVKP